MIKMETIVKDMIKRITNKQSQLDPKKLAEILVEINLVSRRADNSSRNLINKLKEKGYIIE
ncbi:hypothetical protein M1328_05430 [Patescibacteria group bacterium]|nr:hypothetical protein [Patescibacteria group bacterium]